ncbi:hypothetical protein P3X46_017502 [Hevea brasiliensis]|uniref:DUF4408 domain-containing protein n=1 Tax=Hevea brasiliensis TaxID=3981 RepID=A0ABQ9LPY1_HEVBR|nr:hypothetical protein P3X46_017502 [Hevea brasiliensis]
MDKLCKAKKLQAMESTHKTHQFLHSIFFHALIALTCSLLCSYPYWFPSLCYSIKQFLFLSLTSTTYSSFFSPKCLFLVVNVIVVFLIGESILVGSHSSPAGEIYDEYVERSRNLRGVPSSATLQEKEVELNLNEEKRVTIVQDEQVKEEIKQVIEETETEEFHEVEAEAQEEEVHQVETEAQEEVEAEAEAKANQTEIEEEYEEEKERDGEEETSLPAEELKRRVEEFIARVNKQRWLEEARLLVSFSA